MRTEVTNKGYRATLSYAKSNLFFQLSKDSFDNNDIVSATITAYYSIFHLCDALYKLEPRMGQENKKSHKVIIQNTQKLVEEKTISSKFLNLLRDLCNRRENVNYEPKLYSVGEGEPFIFDTCKYKKLPKDIEKCFDKINQCYLEYLAFLRNGNIYFCLHKDWCKKFIDFYLEWGVITPKSSQIIQKRINDNSLETSEKK